MAPSGMELDNGAPIINAYESVAAFEDVFLAQDDLDPHLQALIDDDRDEDRGDNDWMSTLQTPSHTENLSQGWDIDEDMMEFGVGGDLVAYGDVTSSEGSQSGYESGSSTDDR